jgi:hypothetical protein
MIRLFIEDQELDVNQGFSNQITYAVDDLQNLDSKATAFSKTIILPGTANNNRLLGNIFEFGAANFTVDGVANVGYNFNASRSAKMRMEYNGVQVIKGTLRLLEIIVDGNLIDFEIALFGELGGFFAKLGNKKIEELNFSEYNHTYNVTNITNSWNNANAGSGYYYPLIDYGNVSTDKQNYDFRAFRPALFVKDILNKIITDNGYTWESNFFNTNFAKRLIVPNNQERLLINKTNVLNDIIGGSVFNNTSFPITNPSKFFQISSHIGDTFTVSSNLGPNGLPLSYWTYNAAGPDLFNYSLQLNGQVNFSVKANQGYNRVRFKIGIWKGVSGPSYTLLSESPMFEYGASNSNNSPKYFAFDYSLALNGQITLSNGELILIAPTFYNASGGITGSPNFNVTANNTSTFELVAPVPIFTTPTIGDTIPINDCLPVNIKQKDFFSSILKMFYLMVTEDKMKDRHFIIEPWVDFYDNNRTTYLDWSDKIQRDEPIRIKPMAELNARYYQLNYKSDNDWKNEEYRKLYNEGYGDRIYDNGFEFAKETDKTEVIFSATTLLGYTISNVAVDKIVSAIYKRSNGLEQQMASNIRILQAKKLTGYSNWFIQNRTPSTITNLSSALTTYGYAGHFDNPDAPNSDLNFGALKELYYTLVSGALSNNLFNAYYSSYMAEITDKDSRVITVKMRLTESDIYNLDFGRYILIDQVLYRLSKVIDYVPGELCKVQLLRVISTNYQ